MVGAKSLGCATCKKRKIKVRRTVLRTSSSMTNIDQCDERFPICLNCERGKRHCPGPKSRFVQFIRPGSEEHLEETQITRMTIGPTSDLLKLELVDRLRSVPEAGYQLQQFGALFNHLPSRIGTNAALDAAVRALLETHRLMLVHRTASQTNVDYYTEAITLIRRDLDRLREKTPSETVCAALILSVYEV